MTDNICLEFDGPQSSLHDHYLKADTLGTHVTSSWPTSDFRGAAVDTST